MKAEDLLQRQGMSNNVAEYAGARRILKYMSTRPPGRITIQGDSNLLINQLSGRWGIKKGPYLPIATATKRLLADLRGLGWQIDFCWILREQSGECDSLSKRTCPVMDKSAPQEGNYMPANNP